MGTALVIKLKTTQLRAYRQQAVQDQNYICPLCAHPLDQETAVLDHRHADGQIRQAIHRFCNTFLGKIENSIARNRISPAQLTAILSNYENYVSQQRDLLHPSYRTVEERKCLAKKRARRRKKC